MASLDEQFEAASEHFASIFASVPQKKQLELYALWNQAVKGDLDLSKPAPSSMNLRKAAKWNARKRLIGIKAEQAKKMYVTKVRQMDPDWTVGDTGLDKDDSVVPQLKSKAEKSSKSSKTKLTKRFSRSSKNKMFGQPSKELQKEFEKATEFAKKSSLFRDKTSFTLLSAYYKQATRGPNTVPAPRGFSRDKYARWRQWASLLDMTKEEAMSKYIAHVKRFAPEFEKDVRSREEHDAEARQRETELVLQASGRNLVPDLSDSELKFDASTQMVGEKEISKIVTSAAEAGGIVYVLTGASGFIGTWLVGELLDRNPNSVIFSLTRPSSKGKLLAKIADKFGEDAASRVFPVEADISQPRMGLDKAVYQAFMKGKTGVDHFFHVAASYDLSASDEDNAKANVDGTTYAVNFANDLQNAFATRFHYVSSIAVAGNYSGIFFEDQLQEGQSFDNAYSRTKYEAEVIVRNKAKGSLRIYRPGIVVGDSQTGVAEKVDGIYYWMEPIQYMRRILPGSAVIPCVEGNSINIVPVDFVVQAMDAIAHNDDPSLDGKAFALVDSNPGTLIETLNTLAKAAHAPSFSSRIPSFIEAVIPGRFWQSVKSISLLANSPAWLARSVWQIPETAVAYIENDTDYDDTETRAALEGTGIRCPPFKAYCWKLWDFFERQMRLDRPQALRQAVRGKVVVVTGASDGIGKVLSVRLGRAGAHVVLVARSKDKLQDTKKEIESAGGTADMFAADLSREDSTYAMIDAVNKKYGACDVLVNNAGRSIRRSIEYHTRDRFHDFQRLMELNFYGSMRTTLGFLPGMRKKRYGHILNVSTIAELTLVPRFAAYVASKSALTSSSSILAHEVAPDNVSVSNVFMPLVATKMLAGNDYVVDLLTPEQACQLIEKAIVTKQRRVETSLGWWLRLGHLVAPTLTSSILTVYYRLEPEKPPKGQEVSPTAQGDKEQLRAIQRLFSGAI